MDIFQRSTINHIIFFGLLFTGVATATASSGHSKLKQHLLTHHRKADPNSRAGEPLSDLTESELDFFNTGKDQFLDARSVSGEEEGANRLGLGPRFNLNSCGGCHAHPADGGSSPPVNPQVDMATQFGAKNKVPSFVRKNGPVLEARFIYKPGTKEYDGTPKNLFVISGRLDAGTCSLKQPNFDEAIRDKNLALRIPSPVFGAGLIEEIPDDEIIANTRMDLARKAELGISGHVNRVTTGSGKPNRSTNDGTVSRFGWKAQNKSLLLFAGEAYSVEEGVSNELFPNERDDYSSACMFNGIPEDHTDFTAAEALDTPSAMSGATTYMRFLAPPTRGPETSETKRGYSMFKSVGCDTCHVPTMKTGVSSTAALSEKTVNLFSDLLLHAMGSGLADGIRQGLAGPDDFRTAPLWGVGQRLFFLHDGRTSDLTEAIKAHASVNPKCPAGSTGKDSDGVSCQSEANKVVDNFNKLSAADKKSIIEFLKIL